MKVIILCAGYATRLYPLTENRPKPLLSIAGCPIIEYILNALKPIETVDEIITVTNHKFAGHFETWAKTVHYPWPVAVIDDRTTSNENRLGAIGDLNYVIHQKGFQNEDLMVIAGDNLFDFDLLRFYRAAEARRPHASIAVFDVKELQLARQYGLVKLGKDQKVAEFEEKPAQPTTTLASCGLYWLPRETSVLLDRYLKDGHNADQPGHYMRWLAQKDALYGVSLQGRWYDIGDLNSYQKADALFRDRHSI
ncbi:MAG: nucleotidyltransferase family protein [Candidatus Omnitrophica bacterium]|nr:nucleotidyltransferase family protein [Candidatus Omnitrophota bacterium]MDD5670291.1 nucleotidyltransferase family protein [Candidatus Omnitrophota bacterium]